MFRNNGIAVLSANIDQILNSSIQEVVYIGDGTGSYTYTLPEVGIDGTYGSKVPPGQTITIRNAGSGANTLNIAKHANDSGIYLGNGIISGFILHVGSSAKLAADTTGSNWYLIDGTNFFDQWDDLEFLTAARSASTNSAALTDIGNPAGVEVWQFQPATVGASANKWLMCQRQITHGWDKQPMQFHVHFTPASSLTATGSGIVVTWTFIYRSVHPGNNRAWVSEPSITMTHSLSSGTMATSANYNASTGGNNGETTLTNSFPSTMILGRLELTSVTNNGVNQSTEIILNGFDAHMKLRKRGTVNAFPEP